MTYRRKRELVPGLQQCLPIKACLPTIRASRNQRKYARKAPLLVKAMIACSCLMVIALTNSSGRRQLCNVIAAKSGRRSLAEKTLCMSYWPEGDGPLTFWEDRFPTSPVVADWRQVWPTGRIVFGGRYSFNFLPHLVPSGINVAYVLPFMHCPEDNDLPGVDGQHDPEDAFFDSAALIKHAICDNSANNPDSGSEYAATLYAIIHSDAVHCTGSNGQKYDRVKVLQSLGYWVKVFDNPLAPHQLVNQPYISANVENDVGLLDLMKLHAWRLTRHDYAVLIDPEVVVNKPLDDAIDIIVEDALLKSVILRDPETNAVSTSMLILRTSDLEYGTMVSAYMNDVYTPFTGWEGEGTGLYPGGMGTSGLLDHYYSSPEHSHYELDACIYLNDASPTCKNTVFDDIVAYKMGDICGQPWMCSLEELWGSWDAKTATLCEQFLNTWANERIHFEETHWTKGVINFRNGTFHSDVYEGFCTNPGKDGYIPMIRDKEPQLEMCSSMNYNTCYKPTTVKPTVSTLAGGATLELTLTTPEECSVHIGAPGAKDAKVELEGEVKGKEPDDPIKDTTIVFVVDVSGSTDDISGIGCASDENNDKQIDDVLDCEIAAVLDLVIKARESGKVKEVGLVSFSHIVEGVPYAAIQDLALTDIEIPDGNSFHRLEEEIRELDSAGWTNFADAVKVACQVIEGSTTENNLVVFISDGQPNRGGSIDQYCSNNAVFQTIAIGTWASCKSDYEVDLASIAQDTGGECRQVINIPDLRVILAHMLDVKVTDVKASTENGGSLGCEDVEDWSNAFFMDCSWYESTSDHCALYGGMFESDGFTANSACCACGGGSMGSTKTLYEDPGMQVQPALVPPFTAPFDGSIHLPPGEHTICTTVSGMSTGIEGTVVECRKLLVCADKMVESTG